jgi:hypothetical protein
VVRAAVLHERLAREGIDLGFDDRHRAPRTAGDDRVLSAQPHAEAVAGLGAISPKPESVVRGQPAADGIAVQRGGGYSIM